MIIIRRIIVMLILTMSFNAMAIDFTSTQYKKYEDEYLNIIEREYPITLKRYAPLTSCADKGNYICAYEVGQHHYWHNRDYNTAFKYLKMAAEPDHYMADAFLAHMYADGQGVLQDYDKAIHYAKKALAYKYENHFAYNIHYYYLKKPYLRENRICSYAWLKVYKALGGTKIFYENGSSGDLTENIMLGDRNSLNLNEINRADNLAREICSKISGCNQ